MHALDEPDAARLTKSPGGEPGKGLNQVSDSRHCRLDFDPILTGIDSLMSAYGTYF
jgi:hypothetical protein